MIDITEKGTKYMSKLLEERHHRDLTRHEVVDLAILGNVWDLRELEGGPTELPSYFENDIADEVVRVRPTYSILSTRQLIQNRLVNMKYEGLLEGTPSTKTPITLSPEEAQKEIERIDRMMDQRGVQWEKG